jgi:hypothetical protein
MQWTLAGGALYAGIWWLPGPAGRGAALAQVGYGAAYFLLGVVLLGVVARWWVRGAPALWRPVMLSAGSLAAAGEIWWRAGGGPALVDRWMVALLGLLAAAILVRLLPDRLKRRWLGIDRRMHDQGA